MARMMLGMVIWNAPSSVNTALITNAMVVIQKPSRLRRINAMPPQMNPALMPSAPPSNSAVTTAKPPGRPVASRNIWLRQPQMNTKQIRQTERSLTGLLPLKA